MVFNDLAADIVLNGFSNGIPAAFYPLGQHLDRLCNAGFHNQLKQRHIIKGRDLPRLIGFNVGVDQMTHIGFIRRWGMMDGVACIDWLIR
ncbi:MAG: hypothetical protein J0648_08525 [Pelodictyon phaeoclathratiforme]|jgi:hypothetical protein|nr:hypothetical protein [Pelodictyon phaeoclathratiforme]